MNYKTNFKARRLEIERRLRHSLPNVGEEIKYAVNNMESFIDDLLSKEPVNKD